MYLVTRQGAGCPFVLSHYIIITTSVVSTKVVQLMMEVNVVPKWCLALLGPDVPDLLLAMISLAMTPSAGRWWLCNTHYVR